MVVYRIHSNACHITICKSIDQILYLNGALGSQTSVFTHIQHIENSLLPVYHISFSVIGIVGYDLRHTAVRICASQRNISCPGQLHCG